MILERLKLKTQMMALVGILLTFMSLNAVFTFYNLNEIGGELREIAEEDMPLTEILTGITIYQLEQAIRLERALRFGSVNLSVKKAMQKLSLVEKEFKDLATLVDKELIAAEVLAKEGGLKAHNIESQQKFVKILQAIKGIEKKHAQFDHAALEIFKYIESDNIQGARKKIIAIEKEEQQLNHELEALLKEVEEFTSHSILSAEHHEKSTIKQMLLMTLFSLIIGSLIGALITRNVLKQIGGEPHHVSKISQLVANGELSLNLDAGATNKTGIYSALIKMVEKLRNVAGNIMTVSENVSSNAAELSISATQMKSNADETLKQVKSIATASEELSANMVQVSSSAEETSSNMHSITTAAEQLSSNMNTVAAASEQAVSNMSGISNNVNLVSKDINRIASSIDKMSTSLSSISESTQTAAGISNEASGSAQDSLQVMEKLGMKALEINNIVKLIGSIAQQTNMLALNATIESASAGVAGKGFSVVASEVKKLAQQTGDANSGISQQIEEIRQYITDAMQHTHTVGGKIIEVSEINNSIAASVREQHQSSQEISNAVDTIANATQDSALNVEEALIGLKEITRTTGEASQAAKDSVRNSVVGAAGVQEVARSSAEMLKELNSVNRNIQKIQTVMSELNLGVISTDKSAHELNQASSKLQQTMGFFKL